MKQLPDRLFARLLIYVIREYQVYVSPRLGACCRFTPTCSEYAIEAIRIHGALRGLFLAIWRILRCNPFTKGGFDPVPPKKEQKRVDGE